MAAEANGSIHSPCRPDFLGSAPPGKGALRDEEGGLDEQKSLSLSLLVLTCGARIAEARSTIERVNSTSVGLQPDRDCIQPMISPSGSWIAYSSKMTNWIPSGGGPNPQSPLPISQIYLFEVATGTTQLISVNDSGDPADSHCENPQIVEINDEGETLLYVFFETKASNLDTSDITGWDVYVRDLNGTPGTKLVTRGLGGIGALTDARDVSVTKDGTHLAIVTEEDVDDLFDDNGASDIYYLYLGDPIGIGPYPDFDTSGIPYILVSGRDDGFTISENQTRFPDIGGVVDQNLQEHYWIAFDTKRALDAEDENAVNDVYVYDFDKLDTYRLTAVRSNPINPVDPEEPTEASKDATISDDGQNIVFATLDNRLGDGDDVLVEGSRILCGDLSGANPDLTFIAQGRERPAVEETPLEVIRVTYARYFNGNTYAAIWYTDLGGTGEVLISKKWGTSGTKSEGLALAPPRMSENGDRVVFSSDATDLLQSGVLTNGKQNVFVWTE